MAAAQRAGAPFSDVAAYTPFAQGRAPLFRFQAPDEADVAPRWGGGKTAAEPIVPGKATPLAPHLPADDAGDPNMAGGPPPDDDEIPHEDHGPCWGCCLGLRGCFGPILEGRYRDVGHPLDRESWRNRPLSIGWFAGSLAVDDLIKNEIEAGTGFFGGVRFGWDYSHFAGFETRFAGTKVALGYPQNPAIVGDVNFFLWDANWLWYPWGDTQWRPFFTFGLGLVDMKFIDGNGFRDHDTVFGMPFGIGVKYRWDSRIAFRFDIMDNVAFSAGNGLEDLNNFSFTGGLELHFGGATRRSYWPWNPSKDLW
jgi:hypothetical protein